MFGRYVVEYIQPPVHLTVMEVSGYREGVRLEVITQLNFPITVWQPLSVEVPTSRCSIRPIDLEEESVGKVVLGSHCYHPLKAQEEIRTMLGKSSFSPVLKEQ